MFARILRSPSMRGALAAALALAAIGAAQAQSNSSGNIAGQAVAGDTVIIQNSDTGLRREITVPKNGKYRARSLPTGSYTVIIQHADGSLTPATAVTLQVGATARVDDPALKADAQPAS